MQGRAVSTPRSPMTRSGHGAPFFAAIHGPLTCYISVISGLGEKPMRRRHFITLLGGAVAAWPLAARAQQAGKLIRIGFIGPSLNNPQPIALYRAFLGQLRDLGFTEQQNLTADYRGLDEPRGPFVNAMELMRPHPDLIVSLGPEVALQAVVSASAFIPVVFVAVNFDPVARGYVASLARPGGNITGVVFQQLEIGAKAGRNPSPGFSGKKTISRALRCAVDRPVQCG